MDDNLMFLKILSILTAITLLVLAGIMMAEGSAVEKASGSSAYFEVTP